MKASVQHLQPTPLVRSSSRQTWLTRGLAGPPPHSDGSRFTLRGIFQEDTQAEALAGPDRRTLVIRLSYGAEIPIRDADELDGKHRRAAGRLVTHLAGDEGLDKLDQGNAVGLKDWVKENLP